MAELEAETIFFGGGTPSLLPEPLLRSLFRSIQDAFDIEADAEITLEANPGTVDGEKLAGFRAQGVNRLSLGVQSAQPAELAYSTGCTPSSRRSRRCDWPGRRGSRT